jgi:hypothetical protein
MRERRKEIKRDKGRKKRKGERNKIGLSTGPSREFEDSN